jgi:NADPH:quinone reductase-like Zn-dependent oxidoreductase
MTDEILPMKAIVVTDHAAGTAGMKLVERPEPQAAINDVVVQVHASGFTSGELTLLSRPSLLSRSMNFPFFSCRARIEPRRR